MEGGEVAPSQQTVKVQEEEKPILNSHKDVFDDCKNTTSNNAICVDSPPIISAPATEVQKSNTFHGDSEEIEDDWFSKLINSKEPLRVPPVDGNSDLGLNCAEIPLLCEDDLDFKEKTMRTLKVGFKKIWKRGSVNITVEDPTYKVAYLGNVLTGWAKGEGCIDKPLSTLWKNYSGSTKPDVHMKISVTQSGLKAITKEHGLIEYWSHRITYCTVPQGLPRIFCWIYRHEGRKLKQELRCHAVLCSKESVAARMVTTLKLRLAQALLDFKRDKLLKQNARLSLANSVYDNPSLPRRKILLSTGSHNYKPPLERSKSAPKLMSIEESLEEEESTPKAKRKLSEEVGSSEAESPLLENREDLEKKNLGDKCEYKLTNLNIVKKICCSIENLVESTSNYGKKFLTERKSNREFCLTFKKPEEPILKKIRNDDDAGEELSKKPKSKKNVTFEIDFDDEEDNPEILENKKNGDLGKGALEMTLEMKDQESDEGSNSLQSLSSCCSDVSSLAPSSSSEKSTEPSYNKEGELILDLETPMERLQTYLNNCNDAFLDKVVLRPSGDEEEEEEEEVNIEANVTLDENEYVELAGNLVQSLNMGGKDKDVPYHKIIKSTALTQGRIESSCLHV